MIERQNAPHVVVKWGRCRTFVAVHRREGLGRGLVEAITRPLAPCLRKDWLDPDGDSSEGPRGAIAIRQRRLPRSSRGSSFCSVSLMARPQSRGIEGMRDPPSSVSHRLVGVASTCATEQTVVSPAGSLVVRCRAPQLPPLIRHAPPNKGHSPRARTVRHPTSLSRWEV